MVSQRVERIVQGLRLESKREGREEGRKEGRKEGRREGRKEGRKEGRREGREEGEQIGIRKGHLAALRRQLEFKFGELQPEAVERLERADVDQLLVWSDRVLTANQLEEVFEL